MLLEERLGQSKRDLKSSTVSSLLDRGMAKQPTGKEREEGKSRAGRRMK